MEKEVASLQDLYNKLTNLSNNWELYTFKSWKSKL